MKHASVSDMAAYIPVLFMSILLFVNDITILTIYENENAWNPNIVAVSETFDSLFLISVVAVPISDVLDFVLRNFAKNDEQEKFQKFDTFQV